GVRSPAYGTRLFQPPIAEMEFDTFTQSEASSYEAWRNGYEQNWSTFFDPIAIRLCVRPDRLAADVTVMPLILNTEYQRQFASSIGGKLNEAAGDPHPEAIAQFVGSMNPDSKEHRDTVKGLLRLFGRDDWTLGWGGRWYTAYLDDDPFWDKFLKAARTGAIEPEFWKKNGYEIPIAISVAVRDPVKAAKFRKELNDHFSGESCKPIRWEQREHQGISYMRLCTTAFETAELHLYSLALP